MKKISSAKEKQNKWVLPVVIILIGFIMVIIGFNFFSGEVNKASDNSLSSNQAISGNNQQIQDQEKQKSCKDVQVPYDYLEEYQETVPYTDRVCETKNLIYSATNDKWDYSTCNKQSEVCYEQHWYGDSDCHTFCSDKSLSYSVDVNNQDEEQGSWKVDIYFYKQNTLYKTIPITQFLYPKTTKTFTGAFNVNGDSPSGDANQDFSAGYSVSVIPTKQVCRDVTKYKEVTKTRTVTRYKTEQKCE